MVNFIKTKTMKKLLFFLFLTFLFSCKKESYSCYYCVTIAKGYSVDITTCEKTEDEIEQFRLGLQLQAIMYTDSLAVTTCKKINCSNLKPQ